MLNTERDRVRLKALALILSTAALAVGSPAFATGPTPRERVSPLTIVSRGTPTSPVQSPTAAWNGATEQYLVVFEQFRPGGLPGRDIAAQVVDARGHADGAAVRISRGDETRDSYAPAVTWNPYTHDYLVVWSDAPVSTGAGGGAGRASSGGPVESGSDAPVILGRAISSDGAVSGPDFRVSGPASIAGDADPTIAANSTADAFLVAWRDARHSTPDGGKNGRADIYGRLVSS